MILVGGRTRGSKELAWESGRGREGEVALEGGTGACSEGGREREGELDGFQSASGPNCASLEHALCLPVAAAVQRHPTPRPAVASGKMAASRASLTAACGAASDGMTKMQQQISQPCSHTAGPRSLELKAVYWRCISLKHTNRRMSHPCSHARCSHTHLSLRRCTRSSLCSSCAQRTCAPKEARKMKRHTVGRLGTGVLPCHASSTACRCACTAHSAAGPHAPLVDVTCLQGGGGSHLPHLITPPSDTTTVRPNPAWHAPALQQAAAAQPRPAGQQHTQKAPCLRRQVPPATQHDVQQQLRKLLQHCRLRLRPGVDQPAAEGATSGTVCAKKRGADSAVMAGRRHHVQLQGHPDRAQPGRV